MNNATITITLTFAAALLFVWQLHEGAPAALWVIDWLTGAGK